MCMVNFRIVHRKVTSVGRGESSCNSHIGADAPTQHVTLGSALLMQLRGIQNSGRQHGQLSSDSGTHQQTRPLNELRKHWVFNNWQGPTGR